MAENKTSMKIMRCLM